MFKKELYKFKHPVTFPVLAQLIISYYWIKSRMVKKFKLFENKIIQFTGSISLS